MIPPDPGSPAPATTVVPPAPRPARGLDLVVILIAAVAAIVLPILFSENPWSFIGRTFGFDYQRFELFGATGSLVLLLALRSAWTRVGEPWTGRFPAAILTLTSFHFLVILTETSHRSIDYNCYEKAARALVAGKNPYIGTAYYYPPLLAQSLAWMYRGLERASTSFDLRLDPEFFWYNVFYLYQCVQFFLISGCLVLCYQLLRRRGTDRLWASGLVAAMFLVNSPVFRTINYNQVNFAVLDSVLVCLVYGSRHPAVAGIALAVGGHVKLFPLLLAGALVLLRRWGILVWTAVAGLLLLVIETRAGTELTVWKQFLEFAQAPPRGWFLRDNGILSFLFNVLHMGMMKTPGDVRRMVAETAPYYHGAVLVAVLYVFWRVDSASRPEPRFGPVQAASRAVVAAPAAETQNS